MPHHNDDAILILCYAVLGLNWSQRANPSHDIPDYQTWRKAASLDVPRRSKSDHGVGGLGERAINRRTNSTINDSCVSASEPHNPGTTSSSEPQTTDDEPSALTLAGGAGLGKYYYLYKGTIPQDYFFKLPDSKDVVDLDLYLTGSYAFVAVITKEKVAVWQRPRKNDSEQWQRVKVFWIPAEPRCLSLADDRVTLRYVIAVFRTEATVINLRTSKVQTIRLEQPVTERFHQLEQQQPLSGLAIPQVPNELNRPSRSDTLPWNSLTQLPFYPNTLPSTSLTEEYSVPPPYSLVADEPLDALHDPVALPSTAAPQLFLATLGRHSFIIDLSGSLFTRTTYSWSEKPMHIEMGKIETSSSSTEQLCIIGFLSQSVEVMDVRTGELIHTVPMSGPVRYLGRWDDKSVVKAIFWTCNVMNRTYVYMLRLKYNTV
ncbi:hypothetical protein Unana1_05646 [Umbelopsis nana]